MYSGTRNAPSTRVVIPFFVLSAISWVVALLYLLFHVDAVLHSPFFNSDLLVITHVLVLGFMCSVIFGALFQLLPVIFLQSLYSEKLGKVIFWCWLVGVIGLVTSFYFDINGVGLTIFGSVLNIGVLLFIYNIWKTIGNSTENKVAKLFVKTSTIWLLLTTVAGLLLAVNFWHPFLPFYHIELLKIHAHLGIFGWFIFLIIGVSSVLFPMFLLVHKVSKKPLYLAYYLILPGLIIGSWSKVYTGFYLMKMGYGLVGVGLISYVYFIYGVYKHRMRKNLAFDLKKSISSFPMLLLTILIAILFLWETPSSFSLAKFYIIIILIGFIATLILGMFYKTLPFIKWLKVYKPYIGKEKTLLPKDLYSRDILKFQYYFHTIGFVVLFIGILMLQELIFYIGTTILLVGAILFLTNVLKVVYHKRKAP